MDYDPSDAERELDALDDENSADTEDTDPGQSPAAQQAAQPADDTEAPAAS